MSDRLDIRTRSVAHRSRRSRLAWLAPLVALSLLPLAGAAADATASCGGAALPDGLKVLAEYPFHALESEVAGIHPHPTDDRLFLLAANGRPAYRAGQKPQLPLEYRGKLLVIDRHTGKVERTIGLPAGNYGGLTHDGQSLYVSSLEPPEILAVDLPAGKVERRIPISGPAGGLKFDRGRRQLLAQLYVSHPHLAVIDPASGSTVNTLWSDDSAMDLADVDGDLLCTWASSFDEHAFGELRRLDRSSGRVTGRVRLPAVHTSMAALDTTVAGVDGFISLVRLDAAGSVAVRRYAYDKSAVRW